MDEIISVISRSLGPAGIFIFVGLGYNVIFATTRVFNLAQGELSVVGAFVALVLMEALGVPLVLALVVIVVFVALLAVAEDFIAVRPVLRGAAAAEEGSHAWIITTLAVAVVLQSTAEVLAGPDPYRFPSLIPDRTFSIGDAVVRYPAIGLFVVAMLTAVGLHLFYTRSLTGKAMTGMSQDDVAAALRGIDTKKLKTYSFALAGLIAGIGAFFISPLTFVFPSLGAIYTFKGFVAIAIGGMGNNAGALIGGVLLAVTETVGVDLFGAAYRDAVSMAFLLLVLLLFPSGILGHRHERMV